MRLKAENDLQFCNASFRGHELGSGIMNITFVVPKHMHYSRSKCNKGQH